MKNKNIKKFLNYLKVERNYSDSTIQSYERDIEDFYIDNKNILKVTEEDVIKYLKKLNDKKMKRTTISRKISSLKSLYKYLNKKGISNINPTQYILYPRKEKKLPNYIEYNELENLLKISLEGKNNIRNNLIIELLYATGLRVSELVNIKLSDIDIDSNTIRVIGKGSKERIVYFGEYAKDALSKYINIGMKNNLAKWLFSNKNGNHLTTRAIELVIEKIIKKISLKTNVSPHTLRHTFATHMVNSGCDIRVLQELLGHENLTTTEVYTHITNEELRNTYLKCHPRKDK